MTEVLSNASRGVAILVTALSTLAAPALSGQNPDASKAPPGGCRAASADTVTGFVYASLVADAPAAAFDQLDQERRTRALRQLSAALVDDTITLEPTARLSDRVVITIGAKAEARPALLPRWPGHPALATEIGVILDPSGALTKPRVIVQGDRAVSEMLLRAFAKPVAVMDEALAAEPQRLRLQLSLDPDSAGISIPLVAARRVHVEGTPPRPHPGPINPSAPRFSSRTRPRAAVIAWYLVDARGWPVASSFGNAAVADRTHARRYENFVNSVRRAVLASRYEPARVGGCAVARRAILRVDFSAEGDAK